MILWKTFLQKRYGLRHLNIRHRETDLSYQSQKFLKNSICRNSKFKIKTTASKLSLCLKRIIFQSVRLDLLCCSTDGNAVFSNNQSGLIGRSMCIKHAYYSKGILKNCMRSRPKLLVIYKQKSLYCFILLLFKVFLQSFCISNQPILTKQIFCEGKIPYLFNPSFTMPSITIKNIYTQERKIENLRSQLSE